MKRLILASTLALGAAAPVLAEDNITVGFAIAKSGWMEAYDTPSANAAKMKIDEINANGGLLGKQVVWAEVDTKTDREQSAKAGLQLVDDGANLLIVSGDYDFGSPAALAAESAGVVSFFLGAEDVKAGIQGVGPYSFGSSVLAATQGATVAEWAYSRRMQLARRAPDVLNNLLSRRLRRHGLLHHLQLQLG
jgi:branched-chain amino acid transport system substrate-binding protein